MATVGSTHDQSAPSASPTSTEAATGPRTAADLVAGFLDTVGTAHTPEEVAADDALADEIMHRYRRTLEDELGAEDADLAASLDALCVLPEDTKAKLRRQADRATRLVLEPLAYKLLEMNGLDPATADAAAADAVLSRPLTRREQAVLREEYSQALDKVMFPVIREFLEDEGIEVPDDADPSTARRELQAAVRPPAAAKRGAIGTLPAALLGAAVAVAATRLLGWLRRLRRQRRSRQRQAEEGVEADAQVA